MATQDSSTNISSEPGNNHASGNLNGSTILTSTSDKVDLTIGDLSITGILSHQQTKQPHDSSVASFRGVKYADIPGRWHEAILRDLRRQNGVLDATKWGPRPPQSVDVLHSLTGHLYPRLSIHDPVSELECLNLNIYTPHTAIPPGSGSGSHESGLPVLFWIHGGAFEWGDGGCEFDGQYLVNYSAQIGRPVVVVSINYRLGMLGFFTSEELRQEARERGEAGYSNLGFHDQRLALRWVKENIRFFGGDASRIMLAGESAGAISVLAHLRGQVPAATSALLMSPGTVWPKTYAETQITFDKACDKLGLGGAGTTTHEKLAALRRLSCEKLYELGADRLDIILCEDPLFFEDWSGQRFEEIATFPSWIQRVMVGKLSQETATLAHHWAQIPPPVLLKFWRQLYNDQAYATELLDTYAIGVEHESEAADKDSHLVKAVRQCTSDALFDKAVWSIAQTHSHQTPVADGKSQPAVHLYYIDQPDIISPVPALHGYAYHSLDNAYLFRFPSVAGEEAPQQMRQTTNDFSESALRLAYGEQPWPTSDLDHDKAMNHIATYSGDGLHFHDAVKPHWTRLVNTPDRLAQFMLSTDLMFKSAGLVPSDTNT